MFLGWIRTQIDVKTSFLNADLNEEIYIEQPEGFFPEGKEEMVYILHKALYGLKMDARMWHKTLEELFTSNGFSVSCDHPSLFVDQKDGLVVLFVLYVDGIIITGNDTEFIQTFTALLKNSYSVRDFEEVGKFLGIPVEEKDSSIKLHHRGKIERMLKYLRINDCFRVSVSIPKGQIWPLQTLEAHCVTM